MCFILFPIIANPRIYVIRIHLLEEQRKRWNWFMFRKSVVIQLLILSDRKSCGRP
jgi:hypothetical protein